MKLIIIGGGLGGLSAGINALLNGYEVEIYEKNPKAGGFCGAYSKNGYLIDHCIHWLIGTDRDSQQYLVWEKLHALNEHVEIIKLPHLLSYYYNGTYIHLSRDYKASWKQWLEFAKEDEKAINDFFSLVEQALKLNIKLIGRTPEETKQCQIKFFKDNLKLTPTILKTSLFSRFDYAKKFKNKVLRKIIENGQAGYCNFFFFLFEYACFIQGNADIPVGGSHAFINRVIAYYKELGGVLNTSTPVKEILLDQKFAISGILLNNDVLVRGDAYISAIPISYLHDTLLKGKFMPLTVRRLFNIENKAPCPSMFIAAFTMPIDIKLEIPTLISSSLIRVGATKTKVLNIRPYYYDPLFVKEGKATVQILIDQKNDDFKYWASLSNRDYQKEKIRIVKAILQNIEKEFPILKDKLELLDVITPKSFGEYSNSPFGAYMSFSLTPMNPFYIHSSRNRWISNLYYAGQWITSPGGTPVAGANGEAVINAINKDLKIIL